MKEVWITVGGAARILERSTDRVRQLADEGVLPCVRTASGLRLFERAAVERLAAQRAKTEPASAE